MPSYSEGRYKHDFLKFEIDALLSREVVALGGTSNISKGMVLGIKNKSVVTEAKASGVGTGVIGEATLGSLAIPGIYKIIFKSTGGTATTEVKDASANVVGTFATTTVSKADVISPSGELVGELAVGTAFASDHINLTVADGDTDWAAGDVITVTVSGDNKYYPSVSTASDGTEKAVAVLLEDYTYAAANTNGVAILRDAVLIKNGLVWDDSYSTDARKLVAMTSLRSMGLICVDSGPVS